MNAHPIDAVWIVITHQGRELVRLSAAEVFPGELRETCALIAYERRISPEELAISFAEAAADDGPPAVPACFFDYWNTVDFLLELVYAVTLHDAGVASGEIAAAQQAGESPLAFLSRFVRKHDLTPVHAWSVDAGRRLIVHLAGRDG